MAAFAGHRGSNMGTYTVDIVAVGFFILEWTVYAVTLEHTAYGRDSLSARTNVYGEVWMRRRRDAIGHAARHARGRSARHPDDEIVRSRGPAFQSRPARVLLCAGLSR